LLSKKKQQKDLDMSAENIEKKQPPVILCIGMAGSGKTTFMQVAFDNLLKIIPFINMILKHVI
jgi:polynucleotide 5'-kinase involved in rRNA processing